MRQWTLDSKNEFELNEVDLQALEDYSEFDDLAGAEAISLLRLHDAIYIEEPVFISDDDKMMEEANTPKIESMLNDLGNGELILYPNPADEYFTVQYRIDDVFKEALLRVVDVNGVAVYSQKLTYEEDQIIIRKTTQLASGSYQCEISLDGQTYLVRTIILK